MTRLPPIHRYDSSRGARVYRIPCEAFPDFVAYVHLVLEAGPPTLVDVGSGFLDCTKHVLDGIASLRTDFGEPISVRDIRRIIITHGHIDHFGGVAELRQLTGADIGVHLLDRRVVTAYEERVTVATKGLRVYLQQAGVPSDAQPALMEMYGFSKNHARSVPVDFTIEDGQSFDNMTFIHTPGHCPGQICIGLGDVLLSADHILSRITPHQSPESIMPYTGLGHYLESLEKVGRMDGFDLALGGHEPPVRDVYKRIDQIRDSHIGKLRRILDMIRDTDTPPTVYDLCRKYYPKVGGFHRLLAIEEVGAHVEYLYQRGELSVVNLDEVQREENPPLRFRPA